MSRKQLLAGATIIGVAWKVAAIAALYYLWS